MSSLPTHLARLAHLAHRLRPVPALGPAAGPALARSLGTAVLVAGLAGCASQPPLPPAEQWHPVPLPGKAATAYEPTHKAGRAAWRAESVRSASMWRQRVTVAPQALGDVSFSWWVDELIANASVAEADREDAPARVMFGFAGDVSRLPMRTRAMFELAHALTGEEPPYATLMYVWDAQLPVGTVVHNPRSDRIRKIVVDSGPQQLGRWRDHRRNLAADFRHAFGEEPGPLTSIALMTDSDNTRSKASSWYGEVQLQRPDAPVAAPPAVPGPGR